MIIPLSKIGSAGLRRSVQMAMSGLPRLVEMFGPQPEPLQAEVTLKNRAGNVEVTGIVQAKLRLACSRCLDPVDLEIEEPLLVTLAPESQVQGVPGEEVQLAAEELDVSFYSGDAIDLTAVLEDELILMVPEQACEEDDQGRCTCCGKAIDQVLKPAAGDEAFHPLAGLRTLAGGRNGNKN